MILITREMVQAKLIGYLNHHVSLNELVDWAESSLLDGELDQRDAPVLREIIARLGLADVRQFGLTWEDFSGFLKRLGYMVEVRVIAA